ncbi:MAG TPA: hypothetical protein DD670_07430 [Planctomycetaceae bacterium]|nr:hypothetical protein [Planctomycetaceae bacterium]
MESVKDLGEIRSDALYTLDEIRRRLGLGSHAVREARRRGLPVRKIGRKCFVLGRDILDFAADSGKGVPDAE